MTPYALLKLPLLFNAASLQKEMKDLLEVTEADTGKASTLNSRSLDGLALNPTHSSYPTSCPYLAGIGAYLNSQPKALHLIHFHQGSPAASLCSEAASQPYTYFIPLRPTRVHMGLRTYSMEAGSCWYIAPEAQVQVYQGPQPFLGVVVAPSPQADSFWAHSCKFAYQFSPLSEEKKQAGISLPLQKLYLQFSQKVLGMGKVS